MLFIETKEDEIKHCGTVSPMLPRFSLTPWPVSPAPWTSSQEFHSGSWSRARLAGGLKVLKKELHFLSAAPALLVVVCLHVHMRVSGAAVGGCWGKGLI